MLYAKKKNTKERGERREQKYKKKQRIKRTEQNRTHYVTVLRVRTPPYL